ncbi:O-antigen ligase [Afifella sp. IM 167]|uniref:O-antigen ligase family protein n=1 Tax=Afifella sp. IM 167 TaxID=2033586 RepID=UPI001CCC6817|nr:O-antigen ligase family protein [Afifella sp. IM 167]
MAVVAGVLAYGATRPLTFSLMAGLFLVSALSAVWQPLPNRRLRNLALLTVALAAALIGWSLLQTLPLGLGDALGLEDAAARIVPPGPGAISVDPGRTLYAIPAAVLPLLVFVTTFILFRREESAFFLVQFLAGLGVVLAVIGIPQFLFDPGHILLIPKVAYPESLTGSFINRNTAAAFFGCAALLCAAVAATPRQANERWRPPPPPGEPVRMPLRLSAQAYAGIWLVGAGACLTALLLTQSRAGIAVFLSGVFVFSAIRLWTYLRRKEVPVAKRLAAMLGLSVLLAIAGIVVAGRALLRFQLAGLDSARWCAYRSTVRAIGDHVWFGTGLGTFPVVFPAYRAADCAPAARWETAHSTYLEGYMALGLPFLFALVLVFVVVTHILITGIRSRRRMRNVPIAGAAVSTLVALHSLIDFPLQVPGFAAYFSAALGACTAVALGRASSGAERRQETARPPVRPPSAGAKGKRGNRPRFPTRELARSPASAAPLRPDPEGQ